MAGTGALVDGVEWPEDAESQSGSSAWMPVAPGESLNKLRIGKSSYGYNYDKVRDGFWQCERCSDQAPRDDGQRWRLFVRIEASQILAFDVVALDGGEHKTDIETVRFFTRDMGALKAGWHKWYMGHDETATIGDFETVAL
jgi:hypothetical protein